MPGLIGFAPVYLNGLLAIFFVFVVPGLVLVRALDIPDLPQRWFVVFLGSLTANHVLVTLIAALHLNPLLTYRAAATALIAIAIVATMRERARRGVAADRGASTVLPSDLAWLLSSIFVLGITYINVWRHGVPNIFDAGDVSVSWNRWALIWSQGSFPIASYGYPQFVPTIWAVTYIFTGSVEQYFAFYIYIVFIVAPIALNAMNLGRVSWWGPLAPGLVFTWFVAEIQEPWLRSTLEQAYPDWIAAVFGFAGVVLFVTSAPAGRFAREQITGVLLSLWLVLIAAATKPLYGLFAIAVAIAICTDAAKYLRHGERNRLIMAAAGLVSIFAAAYALNYAHLAVHGMPNYPVSELSERLSRAVRLLNSNFTLPFRILVVAGLCSSPFLPRIRWLALPLLVGFGLWANTASYDLRNLLGLLLISAFIPVHALMRAFMTATRVFPGEARWRVADAAVALGLAILSVGLTLPLAKGDAELKQRFANDQLGRGLGLELNRNIETLLVRGCTVFSADGHINTIAAFAPYRDQMRFFYFTEPMTELLKAQFEQSKGCTAICYPPDRTHPSILNYIHAIAETRGFRKVTETNGMVLLSSP